jgi:regulator of RNase E activity RraA
VCARGVNHLGPYKVGPGEIGGPVHAGGTVVRSGDVVVADADGVVVVPRERLAEVVAAGERQLRAEEAVLVDIAAGTWDRSWVLAALTEVPVGGEVRP